MRLAERTESEWQEEVGAARALPAGKEDYASYDRPGHW